jgi:hypothetical protein
VYPERLPHGPQIQDVVSLRHLVCELYVADEGNGAVGTVASFYNPAKAQTTAGFQKWIFDSGTGNWKMAYVLQAGLNLGVPDTITGYPTGNTSGTRGTGNFPGRRSPTASATSPAS